MKILITIQNNSVAPRFDLTSEIVIAESVNRKLQGGLRTIILPRKSAEDLSDLIVKEGINCVICGSIEESYYKFFTWKKITVIDGVIGSYDQAIELAIADQLQPGCILSSAKNMP
jgi:predicted Fe-Mo cluster-binding NifX family protein